MFIPPQRKWSALGGGPRTKFTIQLTVNYDPADGTTDAAVVTRFPVLSQPADAARPTFGIAKRKMIRQDNWSLGWGQFRYADPNRFWYGTAHTFRDNEISAVAKLNDPSTNITAATVSGFCEYGSTRTLYAWGAAVLYSYDHATEAWSAVDTTAAGGDLTGAIVDVREEGGVLYVARASGSHYFTLTGSTWADGGSIKSHFCYHDGTVYAAGDPAAATGHKLYYGAAWANEVEVGGSEDNINAIVSFKGGLYVLKSDGLYVVFTLAADPTIPNFKPSAKPVQTFSSQRSANLGKYWAIWGDRLWFNCGTSPAYFDGLDVVLVEYPWAVAPTPLSNIYSITAMDDCLLVGFAGYALAYHDKGAGMAGDWHCVAYLGLDTRQATALWFSRIPATNRLWIGLDDIADNATNTKYLVMANGLFMPATFAASSTWYSSWMDDTDQTITKWLMEVYVEVDNCSAAHEAPDNGVTLAYCLDGGTTWVDIGSEIQTDGITKLPTTGYVVDGSGNKVTFRSLQLRATIASHDGAISPIIKAIEVVFQPRTPDRRQWDLSLLCQDDWELGTYTAKYTAKQYRDTLWAAAQQDIPITFTDEYGDAYTVSMVLVETTPDTEEGTVTGNVMRVHLEEV